MSRRVQENLMAGALLLVFTGFLVVGFSYGPKTRLVPVPLAAISIVLIALQLYLQNFRGDIKLNVDAMDLFAKQSEGDSAEGEEGKTGSSRGKKELAAMGLVGAFVALILLVGLFQAVLLFVFGYFMLIGREKWLKSLIYSTITVGILYGLFTSLLGVPAYGGLLAALL